MPYGYLGTTPNQQLNNSGVFSVEEALALKNVGELGGSMELIQSQTASSEVVNFTNLGDYDVHFVTFNNVMLSTDDELLGHRLSNASGSVTSGYQFAIQYNSDDGGNGASVSTSYGYLSTLGASGNAVREVKNGYVYYYNLLNSSKYSFCTLQSYSKASVTESLFGGGVLPTAETHNAISFLTTGGSAITSGTFKLYGVKQIWVT